MKQTFIKIMSSLAICSLIIFGGHTYAEHLVRTAIREEISARESQIKAEMETAVENALQDPQTQEKVQQLLNQAVAKELEQNGETHVTNIIQRRYPRLMPFLQTMERSE